MREEAPEASRGFRPSFPAAGAADDMAEISNKEPQEVYGFKYVKMT